MALMEKISLIYEQFGKLMEDRGIDYHSSDGPWRATLKAGTLIEDDFVTGNFGSKAPHNFSQMVAFIYMARNGPHVYGILGWLAQPLERTHHHCDPKELAEAVREVLEQGSINLHVPWWNKLFGFMNGCLSSRELLICHKSHLTTMMPF